MRGSSRDLQVLRSSQRKFALCERFERLGGVVRGRAYPKLKSRSVVVLRPLVKKKPLFLSRALPDLCFQIPLGANVNSSEQGSVFSSEKFLLSRAEGYTIFEGIVGHLLLRKALLGKHAVAVLVPGTKGV